MSRRYVTAECEPLGSAQCDGYGYGPDEHRQCDCPCHGEWDLPSTVDAVRDWHDQLHGVEVRRQVREGLRPLVGRLVDA